MANDSTFIVNGLRIPWGMISEEVEGLYSSTILSEFRDIIGYYDIYENGAPFTPENKKADFKSSDLHFKEARKLINKEARFLFSKHPDIWVEVPIDKETASEQQKEEVKQKSSIYQSYINSIIKDTGFFSKLVKAAKDCFIGKRIAWFVNFDEVKQKITIDFIPSLEFIFETDETDINKLTKIVAFYTVLDSDNKAEQVIYKKKYWLDENTNICWINEALYDGLGNLKEELIPERPTLFEGVIPAGVIINDGLTGDLDGISEIEELSDSESWYSRINNGDIDSERSGMNPIRYAIDINPNTTKDLSIAPGAFWDLSSDPNSPDGSTGSVGMMETSLGYSSAVDSTLKRIRASMYESIDMPDISAESMQGVVTSGKTLKAIYWSLIVRCEEKMLAWRPAIEQIVRILISGGKLYPKAAEVYLDGFTLPDDEYEVTIDNQYPIPDDEADEKIIDLQEVNAQTMSRMSYMKKWRNLTDSEAMAELQQIAMERELLESSYSLTPPIDRSDEQDAQDDTQDNNEEMDQEQSQDDTQGDTPTDDEQADTDKQEQ